jgi:hypothetical protein
MDVGGQAIVTCRARTQNHVQRESVGVSMRQQSEALPPLTLTQTDPQRAADVRGLVLVDQSGYEEPHDLKNGFRGWRHLPTQNDEDLQYRFVHPHRCFQHSEELTGHDVNKGV